MTVNNKHSWLASAPSNIALIKYMGKLNHEKNFPTNSSLSYTLNHLTSHVKLESNTKNHDIWLPFENQKSILSDKAQNRFIQHLIRLKQYFNYEGFFIIRSDNNFPGNCGIASSASSFAALTQCAVKALSELTQQSLPDINIIAQWSREGSGSSCRSFFSPWCLWSEDKIMPLALPYESLIHQVIIVSHDKKAVSSSEAHKQVTQSPLFTGRAERAENRLSALIEALKNQSWPDIYELCWTEFWDMHALFETSNPAFGYLTHDTLNVIQSIRKHWEKVGDGPIVTIDAGPNVHLLYRPEQLDLSNQIKLQFKNNYAILSSMENNNAK
ncbi:MAG: diphosphomevalonate/mevalonate 3,5-bisphosphate decarboxylase family protein [Gammaproteobacteria bacterium]